MHGMLTQFCRCGWAVTTAENIPLSRPTRLPGRGATDGSPESPAVVASAAGWVGGVARRRPGRSSFARIGTSLTEGVLGELRRCDSAPGWILATRRRRAAAVSARGRPGGTLA